MCHRRRTYLLVSLGAACWLALTPAPAEAQRGRAIAQAAGNYYLSGGYRGGYGYPRYFGGYTTAYGNGYYGGLNAWNGYGGGYPVYGYNNGGYGYGYGGGYPAYGYGVRRSAFDNAMAYRRGGFYYDD
jgi:hypothetical protein